MNKKGLITYSITLGLIATGLWLITTTSSAQELTAKEKLGRSIFFDKNLSINRNQSCAACHDPEVGWTGPDASLNKGGAVYEGSITSRFGNRKPPSSAYATSNPNFHFDKKKGKFLGGNFWDGRATGEKLGNPAADQAQGPFLNPLEQALSSPADIVSRVCAGSYADQFKKVWGADVCDQNKVDAAYDKIALSIAAYEASSESNAFTSKYDYYLKGLVVLTNEEKKGLSLFKTKGMCASCHTADPGPDGTPPLFTNFTYDNLGMPRNPENPFYTQREFNKLGEKWLDQGLGEFLASRKDYQQFARDNYGKQKVPTLRNVDKRPYPGFVKAYSHNGYFKSLKSIVHFYNTRDIDPLCANPFAAEKDALAENCWPAPENSANVNKLELGNLRLTGDEEDAIVTFLKTLSDGYRPEVPPMTPPGGSSLKR
jgi:cytochrome c peroxidase